MAARVVVEMSSLNLGKSMRDGEHRFRASFASMPLEEAGDEANYYASAGGLPSEREIRMKMWSRVAEGVILP